MIERRQLKDRRKGATRPISRYTFVGRRKKSQRLNESDNYYVDRYELHLLILTGLILVFFAHTPRQEDSRQRTQTPSS